MGVGGVAFMANLRIKFKWKINAIVKSVVSHN